MKFWQVNPDADDLTEAQKRYDAIVRVPIFFLAVAWLVSAIFRTATSLHDDYGHQGWWIANIVTALFVVDLVIRFILDPQKRHFIKRMWPLIVCIIVPFLRIVLVLNAIRAIRRDRNALTKMVFLYALYGVLTVMTIGGALVLSFEIDGPGSIHSYGDAVWWSLETVTTVGYGDFTPVTPQGRVIAAIIMFTGAAAVGALTAAVASRFISGGQPAAAPAANSSSSPAASDVTSGTPASAPVTPVVTSDTPDELRQSIAALTAKIDQLSKRLEGGGE